MLWQTQTQRLASEALSWRQDKGGFPRRKTLQLESAVKHSNSMTQQPDGIQLLAAWLSTHISSPEP